LLTVRPNKLNQSTHIPVRFAFEALGCLGMKRAIPTDDHSSVGHLDP
jgi:hypothetical protein